MFAIRLRMITCVKCAPHFVPSTCLSRETHVHYALTNLQRSVIVNVKVNVSSFECPLLAGRPLSVWDVRAVEDSCITTSAK